VFLPAHTLTWNSVDNKEAMSNATRVTDSVG
jgi:hypothetical protein